MIKTDNRRTEFIILSLIPVLAVMGTIFWFSSQTAEASTVTSGGFVDVVMGYITKMFGEISADAYEGIEFTVTFIVRKAAHFLEFAALGFFAEIHLRIWLSGKTWLFSFVFSVLYACSDEIHQHFVSERAPRLLDVCVDSAGALCAVAAVCLLVFVIKKIQIKRGTKNG